LSSSAEPLEGAKQKFYGTGRRKESIARVFLTFGSGKISINGRTPDEYFRNVTWRNRAVEPMKFTETSASVDMVATVKGGGVGGQSGAVRMGLSRALFGCRLYAFTLGFAGEPAQKLSRLVGTNSRPARSRQ
jgi:ribosomal protein S9